MKMYTNKESISCARVSPQHRQPNAMLIMN